MFATEYAPLGDLTSNVNDFGIGDLASPSFGALVASTTFKPEATTLNFPSQQPQLSNGVTFANLLKRARLRTSEDNTFTTPLTYAEEGKNISKDNNVIQFDLFLSCN